MNLNSSVNPSLQGFNTRSRFWRAQNEESSSDESSSDELSSAESSENTFSSDDELSSEISKLSEKSDSPNRAERATQASELCIKLFDSRLGLTYNPTDVNFHNHAFVELDPNQNIQLYRLYRDVYSCFHDTKNKSLNALAPTRIINMAHLTTQAKQGFHYCPPEKLDLLFNIVHSTNGVFQASFFRLDKKGKPCLNDEGKPLSKDSSFFPNESIPSEENLLTVILDAKTVVRQDNRALCKVSGLAYRIEMYYKKNVFITSAFPIFFYAKYTENTNYRIIKNSASIPSSEILRLAQEQIRVCLQTGNAQRFIQYKILDSGVLEKIIVNMAPHLHLQQGAAKVEKGVLFKFPIQVLAPDVDTRDHINNLEIS